MNDRRLGLVLDSLDPQRLAPFWAVALDYVVVADVDNYVVLVPSDGRGPKLLIPKATSSASATGARAATDDARAEPDVGCVQ